MDIIDFFSIPEIIAGLVAVLITWLGTRAWYKRTAIIASAAVDLLVELSQLLAAVRELFRDGAEPEEIETVLEKAQDTIKAITKLVR